MKFSEIFIKSFKIMGYTFQKKITIIGSLIMVAIGIFLGITGVKYGETSGYFWGAFAPIFAIQAFMNVMYSKYVTCSPKYKELITKGSALIHTSINLVGYLVFVLGLRAYAIAIDKPFDIKMVVFQFLTTVVSLSIYMQVYYRNPILGFMCCSPVIILAGFTGAKTIPFADKITSVNISDNGCLIAAPIVIILSGVVLYGISVGLYKYPYSDKMMNKQLANVK